MTTWIELAGRTYKVVTGPEWAAAVDGVEVRVDARALGAGVLSLLVTGEDGRVRSYECVADGDAVVVDGRRFEYALADPRSLRTAGAGASEAGPRALKAPMPGRIVRVLVSAGETVEQGQGCVVIEAMKMQNELKAPKAGVVGKMAAVVGETVGAGAVLLVVE